MKRIAVTGVGIISPVGNNKEDFFGNLLAGRSGVRRIEADFSGELSVKVAAQADFNWAGFFTKKQASYLDRAAQLALAAAAEAWKDSGIELAGGASGRAGVFIGTGMGGAQSLDNVYLELYKKGSPRVSPLSVARIMANSPASHISIQYGLRGSCLTYSTACSSSAVAVGEAYRHIKHGYADIMLAGGTESLVTYGSMKCWESLGVLAQADTEDPSSSCKPFSKDRTGFVLGEGAAVIVLEDMERARRRSAQIYGEIAGYGGCADAHHITGPDAAGQAEAMRLALLDAKANIDEIDYINAHGTATAANDVVETQAIKAVFGQRAYKVPVSSTKSMHGHMMGAAGVTEFLAALLSIKNKSIPPTANLRVPDPECDLDYVPSTGRIGVNVRTVMSNSFAFGGTNAVIIARRV